MGVKYLIDTNIAIEYLNNTLPEDGALLIDKIDSQISIITRMEMLAWPKATSLQIQLLQSFIDASVIFHLDELVVLKAIDIRKNFRTKLPDAIIAATAIVNNLNLITRNKADFNRIEELLVIDPFDGSIK